MAAPFVLDLGLDHIRLLRRTPHGLDPVGEVPTDAPDLTPRLKGLTTQTGEDPLYAELWLPSSQFLFTTVDAPGPDGTREAQVRAGLDGLTPYALDEITFDWDRSGATEGQVRVAAVALETLDEARRFARAYGVTAAAFSTEPATEDFPRQPLFPDPHVKLPVVPPAPVEDVAEDAPDDADDITRTPEATDLPAEATVADEVTEETPTAATPSFTSRRAGPVLAPDGGDAGPALRVPSRLTPVAGAAIGPDVAGASLPAADADLPKTPTVTTNEGFTSDRLPDLGPAAASLTPKPAGDAAPRSPARAVPASESIPASRPAEQGLTPTQRRLATAAAVAALVLAGGWTLVSTFTPGRDLPLPVTEAPTISEVAPAPAPSAEDQAAFAPTAEELAEDNEEGLLPGDVADLAPFERSVFEDTPPIGRGLALAGRDDWQRAPSAPVPPRSLDDSDVELAAIDPVTTSRDAIALPRLPVAEDEVTILTAAPPALGQATETTDPAQAAVDAVPPVTPGGVDLNLTTEDTEPAEPESPDGALQPTALAAALPAETRPRLRPEGLVEQNERAQFNGRTRAEMTGLRPRARPASPQNDPDVDPAPTTLAVLRTPLPPEKPANFDELVAAALAPPPQVSAAQPEAVASASTAALDDTAAIEEADEIAAAAPAPSQPNIPTRAEVAREATIDNAIRLNRLNLIGVYGSDSSRRALLRLPSGRYVKVKVGDRVDGGQVSAISDSQLRYTKGGQDVTLTVPSG